MILYQFGYTKEAGVNFSMETQLLGSQKHCKLIVIKKTNPQPLKWLFLAGFNLEFRIEWTFSYLLLFLFSEFLFSAYL